MTTNFRTDKVVVITWSSKGLGKQTALYLAKKGAQVIINGREKKTLQEVTKNIDDENANIIAIQADLSQAYECEEMIESIIKTHKKIDVLINNLWVMTRWSFAGSTIETLEYTMKINLMSTIYITKYALPYIKESKWSIISILSPWSYKGIANMANYCWSKMAVLGLMEWIREEVKKDKIHVWVIVPGYIEPYKDKTIYDNQGTKIRAIQRKRVTNEQVVMAIEKAIIKRKEKIVVWRLTKLFLIANKRTPRIVNRIVNATMKKQEQEQKELVSTEPEKEPIPPTGSSK